MIAIASKLKPAMRLSSLLAKPEPNSHCLMHSPIVVRLALVLGIIGIFIGRGQAQSPKPPSKMSYQGFVVDGSGNPLATNNPANYDMVFRIYNAPSQGTLLWSERQTVTVDKGNFSVSLGDGAQNGNEPNGDLSQIFQATDASDRYIELTVTLANNTAVVIAPRLHLVASPYSFLSRYAVGLLNNDGSSVTNLNASAISAGTIPDGNLSANVALLNSRNSFSQINTFNGNIEATLGITLSGAPIYLNQNKDQKYSIQYGSLQPFQQSQLILASPAGVIGDINGSGSISWKENSVGINTSPSAYNLDVKGVIHASSDIKTDGQFTGNGTIPIGGIIMWSGSLASVPQGWAICDGTQGAPDLRNRFILGAGQGTAPPNTTGGSNFSPVTFGTTNEVPFVVGLPLFNVAVPASFNSVSTIPPYYSLAFIMRVQ